MAERRIVFCDFCGDGEPFKDFYDVHDWAEGRLPPKFVTVQVSSLYNTSSCRVMRYALPASIQGSKEGTAERLSFTICLDCAKKPLFEMLDLLDCKPQCAIHPEGPPDDCKCK